MGEGKRDRAAEAACATGDEDSLAGEGIGGHCKISLAGDEWGFPTPPLAKDGSTNENRKSEEPPGLWRLEDGTHLGGGCDGVEFDGGSDWPGLLLESGGGEFGVEPEGFPGPAAESL